MTFKITNQLCDSLIKSISSLKLDHETVIAYDYFRSMTANQLDGGIPDTSFVVSALQLSEDDSLPLLYVLSAVGSMHRAEMEAGAIGHVSFTSAPEPRCHRVALKQYGQALVKLQQFIDDRVVVGAGNDEAVLQVVLLSSLLLTLFEVLNGELASARLHLQKGRKLLGRVRAEGSDDATTDTASYMDQPRVSSPSLNDVLKVFNQLDGWFGLDEWTSNQPWPLDAGLTVNATMPEAFESLEEARYYLDMLRSTAETARRELLRHTEDCLASLSVDTCKDDYAKHYAIARCLSRTIHLEPHGPLLVSITRLKALHTAYRASLAALVEAKYLAPADEQALAIIRFQHFYSHFQIATCRDTHEAHTDRWLEDFKMIVDLAEHYMRIMSAPPTIPFRGGQIQKSFHIDYSLLTALYLVVVKCRCSNTRGRAVRLLAQLKRQEGQYYSGVLAGFGGHISKLEERRAREAMSNFSESSLGAEKVELTAADVPESARFCDVVYAAELRRPSRGGRVICTRFMHEKHCEGIELITADTKLEATSDGGVEVIDFGIKILEEQARGTERSLKVQDLASESTEDPGRWIVGWRH